jgi:hypothetical protein
MSTEPLKAPLGRGQTRGKANSHRERVWFSEHCLRADRYKQRDLLGV